MKISPKDLDDLIKSQGAAQGAAQGANNANNANEPHDGSSGNTFNPFNSLHDANGTNNANSAPDAKRKKVKKVKEKPISETGWSMDDFRFPACILSVGKPKSGKTYNTRFMISYFSKDEPIFKGGLVFTGSRDLNDDYDFLPPKAIINGYDEDILQRYVAKLEAYRKQTGNPPPASFIVFDDLLGKLQGSAFFNNFISIYRHLNITVFINVQYVKNRASNTLLRECIKYAFVWNTTTKNSLQCLYEVIGQLFDSYEEFKRRLLKATHEKHAACLYIADRDDPNQNYFESIAPEDYKQHQIEFK